MEKGSLNIQIDISISNAYNIFVINLTDLFKKRRIATFFISNKQTTFYDFIKEEVTTYDN